MNLLNEISKDYGQFMRDGRALFLMLAVPILVIIILGVVFSGSTLELKKTAFGYCDLDKSNSSMLFISGIASNTELKEYSAEKNCGIALNSDVKSGKLTAALIIPPGFEDGIRSGNTQHITILLDNSRFQVSPTLESFVNSVVQQTGQKIGTQFILKVWSKLSDADTRLATLLDDAKSTREKALVMKASLKKTTGSLSSMDINSVKVQLDEANTTLNVAYASLDIAQGNLTKIESDFADYDSTLSQTEADLANINNTLAAADTLIIASKEGIDCNSIILIAYCASLDSLNASISSAQSSVESRMLKVREGRMSLHATNITIQEFKSSIAAAKNSSNESLAKLENMKSFITQLEQNRQVALETMAEIDSSLDQIIEKTYELEGIITESRAQILEITSREPQSVISPILLSSFDVLGKKPFFRFLLPSLLPLVLMFVALFLSSTSLVREKYYGTFVRIQLSQVNLLEFIAYKTISYTVVMLPSSVLVLLLSSWVYNAFNPLDLSVFLFLLAALSLNTLVFCSIGVLIALFSKSESTAFLASLVIGLPLLFMSGILFPFEFMPSQMAALGIASPLTQAMLAMQSAITYNALSIMPLFTLAVYGISITLMTALALFLGKNS